MKYKLIWKAYFNDEVINQFDDVDQTKENLFKKVLERQDKLKLFCLFNVITKTNYIVDLVNGAISIGGVSKLAIDHINKQNNRVIYFRRIVKEITLNKTLDETLKEITYFIGFQYTVEGRNVKKIIQIYEDGRIVIY